MPFLRSFVVAMRAIQPYVVEGGTGAASYAARRRPILSPGRSGSLFRGGGSAAEVGRHRGPRHDPAVRDDDTAARRAHAAGRPPARSRGRRGWPGCRPPCRGRGCRARAPPWPVTRSSERVLVRRGDEAEEVGGEEGDLEHVVAAEGVVGVLDVVLAERHRDPEPQELPHGQVQRPGVRVGDEPETGPLARPASRSMDGSAYWPTARAWQATPLPTRSWRSIASASIAVVRSDGSPASSTSMATRRPVRAASAQAHSTWASASASVCSIHGMPPTTSAPISSASSHSCAVPGSRSSPSCGKATTWRSRRPRYSSRTARTAAIPSSPPVVSTSTKAWMCSTPWVSARSSARRMLGSSHDRS